MGVLSEPHNKPVNFAPAGPEAAVLRRLLERDTPLGNYC